jgi:hypothetical protein
MKQTFACGHTGKGKFCHTCANAEKDKAEQRLAKVSNGIHPFSLDGKFLKSSAGKLVSVPVGSRIGYFSTPLL